MLHVKKKKLFRVFFLQNKIVFIDKVTNEFLEICFSHKLAICFRHGSFFRSFILHNHPRSNHDQISI
ncbi:hypothetical protein PUN28_002817 [Cardiocondyla obscurior]|uniref:Uncharacterized protein n=1 Tax=Cardiocondyla obscurior TaxID=286306 RepID=A0AAW2GWF8_9HYME